MRGWLATGIAALAALPLAALPLAASCGRADDAPSCAKANEQVMILTIKELEARVENLSRGGKDLVVRNFEMAEQRCEADKWSAEVRRCLRQATTIAAAGACSQRLDAEQRKHLDEALALRTFPEQTKAQAAKVAVLKLVHEAYPQWAMAKPGKACPDSLAELIEYAEVKAEDPWGRPYRLLCGASLPANAVGLAVVSDGADGKPDSDDDVKSW